MSSELNFSCKFTYLFPKLQILCLNITLFASFYSLYTLCCKIFMLEMNSGGG